MAIDRIDPQALACYVSGPKFDYIRKSREYDIYVHYAILILQITRPSPLSQDN